MKRRGLLNKHCCKTNSKQKKVANFHFSHYKSMENISCHSNHSSYPNGIKNIIYVEANDLSMYAKFQLNPPYFF